MKQFIESVVDSIVQSWTGRGRSICQTCAFDAGGCGTAYSEKGQCFIRNVRCLSRDSF